MPIKTKFHILISTVLGNIMEFYDFAIFGFMLKYMQDIFLPNYDSSTKYILSFLLFSIGFLGRPIGAYLLGKLAEIKGRKYTIALSISLLTLCTTLIGLLPTFQQVGMLAPLLLILLRLAQNISVSVEQIGGALYLIESFPKNKKYFVSSFMFGTVYLGHIIGLAAGLILATTLSYDEILQWGWRIPFILSLPIGCFTLYLRLKLAESPLIAERKINNIHITFDKKQILSAVCSFVSLSVSAYLTVIYIPNMLHMVSTLSSTQVFGYATIVNFLIFAIATTIGSYADKNHLNGKKIQSIGLVSNIFFAIPIYYLLHNGSLIQILFAQLLSAFILGIQAGTILGCVYDNYSPTNRLLTLNIGFNIAMTFFGGLSPFIVAYFAKTVHYLAPAIYLMLLSSITLVSIRSDKNIIPVNI